MNARRTPQVVIVVLLLLSMCSQAFAQTSCYPNAPIVLECYTQKIVKDIVENNDPDRINQQIATPMFYAIADAVTNVNIVLPSCDIEDYQHFGETARTDKQIGASAKSEGSTSLVEKPGFARLLGFAIEHGAIKQAIDDTTLTLSTTPYALVAAANREDTAALYGRFAFFNRFGISASFNISDNDNILANASRKQLTEWSARVRLTGDRSSRGKDFRAFWKKSIADYLDARLAAIADAEDLMIGDNFAKPLYLSFITPGNPNYLSDKIKTYLAAHESDSQDKKISDLKELILCELKKNVYDPLKLDPSQLGKNFRDRIPSLLANIKATSDKIKSAKLLLDEFIKGLDNKPLGTFEYTNHREAMGSDYSELKFLFRANMKPMKILANAGISLYNNPDRAMNQERVRDFNFALSLEGEASNPFAQGADLSKITYSFSGSYERFKEAEGMMMMTMRKPDLASAQFKLEIPIALGLSIPVAYTYSSATETSMKKENKFNIGLNLDMDKLFELTRSNKH